MYLASEVEAGSSRLAVPPAKPIDTTHGRGQDSKPLLRRPTCASERKREGERGGERGRGREREGEGGRKRLMMLCCHAVDNRVSSSTNEALSVFVARTVPWLGSRARAAAGNTPVSKGWVAGGGALGLLGDCWGTAGGTAGDGWEDCRALLTALAATVMEERWRSRAGAPAGGGTRYITSSEA
jgi:hypothetical protein